MFNEAPSTIGMIRKFDDRFMGSSCKAKSGAFPRCSEPFNTEHLIPMTGNSINAARYHAFSSILWRIESWVVAGHIA
jgi:hypothetical protein